MVVTGAARGVGRGIAEKLLDRGHIVAAVDLDETALTWTDNHPDAWAAPGDAADEARMQAVAEHAEALAPLTGWVNNAAVFRDAALDTHPAATIVELITTNLSPTVVGTAVAVRHLLAAERAGSIVTVSSHQAQRAVRGALPYATAKAAVEGLVRAAAVDHGPAGIRVNAVALGSVETERSTTHRSGLSDPASFDRAIAEVQPLGRIGTTDEVAEVVTFLLSPASGFISGAVIPVDGARAAQGIDPEAVEEAAAETW